MTNNMNQTIDEISLSLLEEAIHMWHRDGAILTTSFAIGHSRSVFAQPINESGFDLSDKNRIHLDGMLASLVGAVVIGRIDESFIAELPVTERPLAKGELAKMAETNPDVKTALVVQTLDVTTNHLILVMGILGIDDEGEACWKFASYNDPEGPIGEGLEKSAEIAESIVIPLTNAQLQEELSSYGWQVADSDDILEEE
jgi:hypothetical protein